MKKLALIALPFLLSACAMHQTPINQLALPKTSKISGTVIKVDKKGDFTLQDASGMIAVDTEDFKIKPPIKVGEKLTVKGVVDDDDSVGKDSPQIEEFDAFAIKREDGTWVKIVARAQCDAYKK